jgi:hypothetical protein
MTMAPARFALNRTRRRACVALCVFILFATASTLSADPGLFGKKKQPAPTQPAEPQFNDDGTPKLDAAGNQVMAVPAAPAPPPCTPSKKHKCPKLKTKPKKKEKPPKVTPAQISRGIFTVDGVIGKAALNYDIPDLKFIYFYAPGIGVVVISDNKFAGSVEEKGAFNGHSLKVKVAGDHVMELYSDDILLGKKAQAGKEAGTNAKPEPAYITYDANFTMPSKFPVVGYGKTPNAPYAWPDSKRNVATKGIALDAPPVPKILTPKLAPLAPCQADGKPAPVKGSKDKATKDKAAQPCAPIVPPPEKPHQAPALE